MKIKVIDYGYKRLPYRAHYNDSGADVFVCLKGEQKRIKLSANETVKIPLGFGLELPDGYAACVFPRSGHSSRGIVCQLPPIDSGYRGEIHAIVTNNASADTWIEDGSRIGQLVVFPIILADFVTELGEERENRAFGSTGT